MRMLCRRRIFRKYLIFILIVFIGLWFFIKSRNFVSIPNIDNNINKFHSVSTVNGINDVDEDTDASNANEVRRMENIEKEEKVKLDDSNRERDRLMKLYNESLKEQEENADPFNEKHLDKFTDFSNFKINFNETKYAPKDLINAVDRLNKNPTIYNYDKLKDLPKEHAVIIVQVHKRIEYFKELLDSLQRSKGIEQTLFIVSHDFYSDEMNALIKIIRFCPVIQIFFPYSLQLYPNEFPGPSEKDCPRDASKQRARNLGCINAESPDKYGHYREAPIVMVKHHWWWKINTVLDVLEQTKRHNGPFLFIEEDHYVAPSFLHALMKLHEFRKKDSSCRDSCDILTLGTYNNKHDFQKEGKKVMRGAWISTQHNMGMTLYRDTWNRIKHCAKQFCMYDDYNWDWTLMHLSKNCLNRQLDVLLYDVPRVYHVGDCGLHHKKSCSTSKDTLNKIKGILERNKDNLFVEKIETYVKKGTTSFKPNGGWGDSRDHDLCLRFVQKEDPL